MKKSCDNCKALTQISRFNCKCSLGYKADMVQKVSGLHGLYAVHWCPAEECPKPKTYSELCKYKETSR